MHGASLHRAQDCLTDKILCFICYALSCNIYLQCVFRLCLICYVLYALIYLLCIIRYTLSYTLFRPCFGCACQVSVWCLSGFINGIWGNQKKIMWLLWLWKQVYLYTDEHLYCMKVQKLQTVQLLLYKCTQGFICMFTLINNK